MDQWQRHRMDRWRVTPGLDYGANGPLQIWPDAAGKYRVTLTTHGVPAGQQTYVRYYKSWW